MLIPAYNEESTVGAVIQVALQAGFAVVVADDGSKDRTSEAAQKAGAKVVRLPKNQGKGFALALGLHQIHTPFLLMLDADLVGIQPQHLLDMLEPVRQGQLDMAIGVFKSGGFMTDFGNRATPHLSGQRACRTDWLKSVPNLAQRWPEPPITDHLTATKARWAYISLEGASQVLKEQKRGLLKGIAYRIKMYYELLAYRLKRNAG